MAERVRRIAVSQDAYEWVQRKMAETGVTEGEVLRSVLTDAAARADEVLRNAR